MSEEPVVINVEAESEPEQVTPVDVAEVAATEIATEVLIAENAVASAELHAEEKLSEHVEDDEPKWIDVYARLAKLEAVAESLAQDVKEEAVVEEKEVEEEPAEMEEPNEIVAEIEPLQPQEKKHHIFDVFANDEE